MSYQDIHPAEAQTLLAAGEITVLDMRDPASYERGHLAHAQPASDTGIKQLLKDRQRERPVLVYCYHGNTSRDLCRFIAGFGYTRVYNLAGGWQAWEQCFQAPPATAAVPPAGAPGPALADWLTAQGFPPDNMRARLDNGMNPLMVAALKGELALVRELLELGADPNHVNDDDHHALWFACVHGDPDLVSLLIAHGADVDNQNVNGATCAIYSASTGKLEVLKRLVEAGANLDRETSGGYTALESASTLPVLKYLRILAPDRRSLSPA
jgi:rhodanese-related sulfurtransferase